MAGGRQEQPGRDDVGAGQAKSVREPEPAGDAAVIRALAVMVDEAAAPFAADVAILATADQAGILQRNAGLIVIAVERLCLHLAFGALAGMKPVMERMQAVIAPGADVAQRGLECIG